jgi:AcrR family transcriptional regulator
MASLAPKQKRSRESLRRLLKSAAEVLQEKGLEAATIPMIARRAGLSPGSVYRRFRDKDALLRTLFLRILESAEQQTAEVLGREANAHEPLDILVKRFVRTTLEGYRKNANLMKALTEFARRPSNSGFRRRIDEIEVRNFRLIVDSLLARRGEITHPNPETAVSLGLMTLGLSLREIVILDALSEAWSPLLPKTDAELTEELANALLKYLGFRPLAQAD